MVFAVSKREIDTPVCGSKPIPEAARHRHQPDPNGCHSRPICMYRLLFANDFWHVLGSRSYVSGLLIDTRVVALLGLRKRLDLIGGQVVGDH